MGKRVLCNNPKCERYGTDREMNIYEQDKTWSFYCHACKTLIVRTKEGWTKDPKVKGTAADTDDPEKCRKLRLR